MKWRNSHGSSCTYCIYFYCRAYVLPDKNEKVIYVEVVMEYFKVQSELLRSATGKNDETHTTSEEQSTDATIISTTLRNEV
jgi:hypothetical protein